MMKKALCLLLLVCLLLPPFALADDRPNPVPVLAPEEIRQTPQGIHHYMLICFGDSWHVNLNNPPPTDGLVLVTIDEYAKRVMLTSFIRDMIIQRDKNDFSRINNIVPMYSPKTKAGKDGVAGLQMLVDTINSHFDLRIEKFIAMDWSMVQNIVDAVGGVDLTITNKEANYLKSYSITNWTTPRLSSGGTYHFPGHAAVIYMRIRKVPTEIYLHADGSMKADTYDVGRTRRARTVLINIADNLKDITYDDAVKLLDVIVNNILYTNMTTEDLMDALNMAMQLKGTPVEQIRMPVDGTYHPKALANMATQEVDFIANRKALWDFFLDSYVVVEDGEE